MFFANSNGRVSKSAENGQAAQVPLHYPDDSGERPSNHEKSSDPSVSGESTGNDGTWGERDAGGLVDSRAEDYDEMRRTLTNLTRTQTRRTEKSIVSHQISHSHSRRYTSTMDGSQPLDATEDVEATTGPDADEEDFPLGDFLKEGHFEKRTDGRSAKKVGLVWKHLTVQGVGATSTFVKTLPNAIVGTFGPDLYRILSRFITVLPQLGSRGERRDLIHDFSGVVREGQMMLVLGRPGSGCSTFLKAVTNKRDGYAGLTGDVSYGGIPAAEQLKLYRGEVNYNEEDDQRKLWFIIYTTKKTAANLFQTFPR